MLKSLQGSLLLSCTAYPTDIYTSVTTDRKNKRHFCAGTARACPLALPSATCQRPRRTGVCTRAQRGAAAPPERPGARRRAAPRGLDMRRRMGYGRGIRGALGRRLRERRVDEVPSRARGLLLACAPRGPL